MQAAACRRMEIRTHRCRTPYSHMHPLQSRHTDRRTHNPDTPLPEQHSQGAGAPHRTVGSRLHREATSRGKALPPERRWIACSTPNLSDGHTTELQTRLQGNLTPQHGNRQFLPHAAQISVGMDLGLMHRSCRTASVCCRCQCTGSFRSQCHCRVRSAGRFR